MAAWNRSRDVNSDPERSVGTSRPPLPRPDKGDNVRPVPLWERGFCRNASGITWETFCEKKQFIEILLFKNVMDWDDSGAHKNFLDAKERFRAKYFGEPYEDPVLDPDLYIDEVDHHCIVDPELVADLDSVADLSLGGTGNMTTMDWGTPIGSPIPPGWGQPVPNLKPTGWGEPITDLTLLPLGWGQPVPNLKPTGWGEPTEPTPDSAWGGQGNQSPGAVMGAQPYSTPNNSNNNLQGGGSCSTWHQPVVDPGQTSSGTARMLPDGGRIWTSGISGGSGGGGRGRGRGSNWNGSGRGNQRNEAEEQNQQRNRGSMQRNWNQGQHQMRSIGRQQQGQRGRRMEWRPVQRDRSPNDDPAA